MNNKKELLAAAIAARELAYAPYSHYTVGAALLSASGKVYLGCNIENASYPATICSERVAMSKAISEGEREFTMLAIAAGPAGGECTEVSPCGICRQFLAEFCNADMPIVMSKSDGYITSTLGELLPMGFGKNNLQ